jgi:hypothetical protein
MSAGRVFAADGPPKSDNSVSPEKKMAERLQAV